MNKRSLGMVFKNVLKNLTPELYLYMVQEIYFSYIYIFVLKCSENI